MTLLTLDVGFEHTGWAVIERHKDEDRFVDVGVITTKKSDKKQKVRMADENAMRGAQIATGLDLIIKVYGCRAMIGELPSGGAKSALAMRSMAAATTAVSAAAAILGIPSEWCSPNDVKLATVGKKSATKAEIMDAVACRYRWQVDTKTHHSIIGKGKRKGQTVEVVTKKFHIPCAGVNDHKVKEIPGGMFEHIADAIGAYWAMRDSNLVRMFL